MEKAATIKELEPIGNKGHPQHFESFPSEHKLNDPKATLREIKEIRFKHWCHGSLH
jgi:hypothetical protein